MIVLADSSPLITLARATHFELLNELYGEVIVSREVRDEITVAGAGLPGADEMQQANWIRMQPGPSESSPEVKAACAGLGVGERSVIYLASALTADLVLIDEERARREAKTIGLNVAGSVAVLERGTVVTYSLFQEVQGLLDQSLARLGLAPLKS